MRHDLEFGEPNPAARKPVYNTNTDHMRVGYANESHKNGNANRVVLYGVLLVESQFE